MTARMLLDGGEPLAGIAERVERLGKLSADSDRERPLEYGLRITTVVRGTTEGVWAAAESTLEQFAESGADWIAAWHTGKAVGQQRLLDLHEQGDGRHALHPV